jgi:hypothetical protein
MSEGTKRSELTALQRTGLERLEACAREGVTIRAYARKCRLSEQQLYQMAKVLRAKGVLPPARRGGQQARPSRRARVVRKPRFVEVRASADPRESSEASVASWRARLPNGVVLEGSTDLERVVEVLAKL